jgi:hypothetical protein
MPDDLTLFERNKKKYKGYKKGWKRRKKGQRKYEEEKK